MNTMEKNRLYKEAFRLLDKAKDLLENTKAGKQIQKEASKK